MIFVLARVFFIFFVVFLFSLVTYVAWKKWIRPTLHKEKLEGELINAQETFEAKKTAKRAEEITQKEEA